MQLLWIILFVGIVVTVHEVGHYLAARLFGVHVIRVTLGVGPTLRSVWQGETEYALCAIPLGCTVRLFGEGGEAVLPRDRKHAVSYRPPWQRALIVLMGPVASMAFPVLLYVQLHAAEETALSSVVGTVFVGQPADGLLRPGDRITDIDGEQVNYWEDVTRIVAASPGRDLQVTIERSGTEGPVTQTVRPRARALHDSLGATDLIGRLGVTPRAPLAQIGVERQMAAVPTVTGEAEVPRGGAIPAIPVGVPGAETAAQPAELEDCPAARAGLRTFDIITSVQGRSVVTWSELATALERNRGEAMVITWLRPDPRDASLGFLPLTRMTPGTSQVFPVRRTLLGHRFETCIRPGELFVHDVLPGSPAALAGIQPGDELTRIDGRPLGNIEMLGDRLDERRGQAVELEWTTTTGARRTASLRPVQLVKSDGSARESIGAEPSHANRAAREVPISWRLNRAMRLAVARAAQAIWVTLRVVLRILSLGLPLTAVGGPLRLWQYVGTAAARGAEQLVAILAVFSLNVGLLHLLPLPFLDGGKLVRLLSEAIAGRPIGERARTWATRVGIGLVVFIVILGIRNDIVRYWWRT